MDINTGGYKTKKLTFEVVVDFLLTFPITFFSIYALTSSFWLKMPEVVPFSHPFIVPVLDNRS